jgi:hypothetical protein
MPHEVIVRVVYQNSADRLSGPPFVVVEDPAQPFTTPNRKVHHVLLVPIDPTSEDEHQKLQRKIDHRSELRPATTDKLGRNPDSMLA